MLCVAFVGDDVISPTLTTYNNADDVNCPTLAGSTKPTGEWITCKSGKPGTHPHMVDSGNMNENFGEGWLTVCHQKFRCYREKEIHKKVCTIETMVRKKKV